MKTCTKCGLTKPLEAFHRHPKRGRTSHCKDCKREYDKARRLREGDRLRAHAREYARAHRDEARERHRKWVAANPERKKAYDRAWREANLERKAAYDRAYGRAHRDRMNANWRAFADRHPERVKANSWRQGQHRRGEKPDGVAKEYRNILIGDGCSYCGAPVEEIDHIMPRNDWDLAIEGWNGWSNLTASCRSCNRRKSDRSLLTFLLIND